MSMVCKLFVEMSTAKSHMNMNMNKKMDSSRDMNKRQGQLSTLFFVAEHLTAT
jgi:hypothetical protein